MDKQSSEIQLAKEERAFFEDLHIDVMMSLGEGEPDPKTVERLNHLVEKMNRESEIIEKLNKG